MSMWVPWCQYRSLHRAIGGTCLLISVCEGRTAGQNQKIDSLLVAFLSGDGHRPLLLVD